MIKCLEYPFDTNFIIKKKKKIRNELLKNEHFICKKIAILGGSTTFEIQKIVDIFLLKYGIKAEFYQSEYNKFYEDVMFRNEELYNFKPDLVYIHTTNKNITSYPDIFSSESSIEEMSNQEIERFTLIWKKLSEELNCSIIQNNFELMNIRELGGVDGLVPQGRNNYILSLNNKLSREYREYKNVYINDINYLSSLHGLDNWFNEFQWYSYGYAVSFESIVHLSANVASICKTIFGIAKKCLVLDLDNTLWGGVIGDDGINGIKIGPESPTGEAYRDFQKYIKKIKQRGIVLAISSKNDYERALEGLEHQDSVLSKDDFLVIKANWNPKSDNIKEIRETINIGFDSLVFIDDNPVERELVKSQLPQVEVPSIGPNILEYLKIIERNNYFDLISLNEDDIGRNSYYKSNMERASSLALFTDYGSFLKSLDMFAEIKTFDEQNIDRIVQLINKTNQFNLTTMRVSISDIQKVIESKNNFGIYGRLRDKYGDNGIITVVGGTIENNELIIDLWLMSCRVLKRTMENTMFDYVVSFCRRNDIDRIIGIYIETEKNKMVSSHYLGLGFKEEKRIDSKVYWSYKINENYIGNEIIKLEGNDD